MRGRSAIIAVLLGLGALLSAGAAAYWWLGLDRVAFYTDGGLLRTDARDAEVRDILWTDPEPLDPALQSERDELAPDLDDAERTIVLARTTDRGDTDLFLAARAADGSLELAAITSLNTLDNELDPALSPDGAWLYFASDRPGSAGGTDLWRAPRLAASDTSAPAFGEPERLDDRVNSPANELGPAPARGGLFAWSSDLDAMPADGAPDARAFAIRVLDLADQDALPRRIEPDSTSNDLSPAFSPAGDFLYFASDRPGGAGGFDLYRARITDTPEPGATLSESPPQRRVFRAPESLGTPVNTAHDELEPAITTGGFAIVFASDRPGTVGGTDLFRAVSREVYLAREKRDLGWLGDLLALLPWLLLALAAVLLLALLTRLVHTGAWHKRLAALSLMAKCVLLSLLLHALLMLLLTMWDVETEPGGGPDEQGTQVRLASARAVSSARSQLRGELTQAVRTPAVTESTTPELDPSFSPETPEASLSPAEPAERAESNQPVRTAASESTAVPDEARPRVDSPATSVPDASQPERIAERAALPDAAQPRAVRESGVPEPARAESAAPNQPAVRAEPRAIGPAVLATPEPTPAADAGTVATERPFARDASAPATDARPAPIGDVPAPLPAFEPMTDVAVGVPAEPDRAAQPSEAALSAAEHRASESPSSSALDLPSSLAQSGDAPAESIEPAATSSPDASRVSVQPESREQDATPSDAPVRITAAAADPVPQAETGDVALNLPDAAAQQRAEESTRSSAPDALVAAAPAPDLPAPADASTETDRLDPAPTRTDRAEIAPLDLASEARDAAEPPEAAPIDLSAGLDPLAPAADDLQFIAPDLAAPDLAVPGGAPSAADRAEESPAFARQPRAPTRPDALGLNDPPDSAPADPALAPERHEAALDAIDADARPRDAAVEVADAPPALDPFADSAAFPSLALAEPVVTIPAAERYRLTGLVLDAQTDEPLAGARIALDLEGLSDVAVETDPSGAFALGTRSLPDQAAVSASMPGYVPASINVAAADLEDGEHVVFRLEPVNPYLVALEDDPEVRHLGDDRFGGRINSQFQRASEGRRLRYTFPLEAQQVWPSVGEAEFRLLVKGSQLSNPVIVNGQRLGRLAESPTDGSFGEQRLTIPADLLRAGENTIEIRSVNNTPSDLDDFEFVNPRLVLQPRDPGDTRFVLSGVVLNRQTERPIPGAVIGVDLVGADLRASSNPDGTFRLGSDELPETFALVVTRPGYEPLAANLTRELIERRPTLRLLMTPERPDEIAIEPEPTVHHLGNDEFDGRVNSRFQRESEGTRLSFEFTLDADQLAGPFNAAELTLLAKGVQADNPLFINGTRIGTLSDSPADGSFGPQTIRFAVTLLREGVNTFEIRSVRGSADLDDFEFVNPRIRLVRAQPHPRPRARAR